MNILSKLLMIIIFFLAFSCNKNSDLQKTDLSDVGHPRILLLKGEEQQIKDLIDSDETWKKVHFAILEESNKIIGKSVLERTLTGRRLLSISRELLRREFFLSYSFRMTGDERFLKKAEEELLAVSNFSDWNPSHFLDVAEMTMGVAIGYDWLFENLSESARKQIRSAILTKGIEESRKNNSNIWWLTSDNNWNQVCNAGMVYGVLAIQEDYPDLADEIIDRAFESIPLSMEAYQPDGVYPEGYGYWGYGTSFNVLFSSAVEKAESTDRGLSSTPGYLQTADFMKHIITPTGGSFNWSDCGTGTNLNPAMFWFAEKTNNPSVLWSEKQFLEKSDLSSLKGIRELPALLVWAKNIPLSNIKEPAEKSWMGQGANPVSMMRSDWSTLAVFLGFKAGSPSVNHGHMDVGSFMMEAEGVRWATDLGMQNYESLESKGMSIFGKTQDAERWTIFRMNTFLHNLLIVDDQQQRVSGHAKIDRYSDAEDFMFSISDISSVYSGQLKNVTRGVALKNKNYTIIRDEFETLDKTTKVRWQMVTYSNVELGNKEATLIDNGKILKLKINGPDNLEMKTWSTAPTNNYDAVNPGTIIVGFECEIPANTKESFEVIMIPETMGAQGDFLGKTLEEW